MHAPLGPPALRSARTNALAAHTREWVISVINPGEETVIALNVTPCRSATSLMLYEVARSRGAMVVTPHFAVAGAPAVQSRCPVRPRRLATALPSPTGNHGKPGTT